MTPLRPRLVRTVRRAAYPALAVAMGISTLVAGLEHSSFLVSATGTQGALAAAATDSNSAAAPHDSFPKVSTRPAEPDSSPAKLDMSINHRRIDLWVARLTTSLRGDFSNSLARMNTYATMITAKLDAKQMPHELIYLAMIESNFNPNARSKVGAVGMWQFMTATAYNSGAGTVSKALMKVTGRTQGSDEDFFRILSSLPREMQDYVPKLIASARVGSRWQPVAAE